MPAVKATPPAREIRRVILFTNLFLIFPQARPLEKIPPTEIAGGIYYTISLNRFPGARTPDLYILSSKG
jgi:hypothetical protein